MKKADPPTDANERTIRPEARSRASSGRPDRWLPKGSLSGFLVRGAAGAFAARLLALVAAIASQAFLARLIPPEALGVFFLAQSIVIMGSNIGEFGLNRPLARMISTDLGAGHAGAALRVLSSATRISILSGLIVITFVVAGPGRWLATHVFDSPMLADIMAWVGLWVAGRIVVNVGSAALQGLHRVGLSALLNGSLSTIVLAVISGLLLSTHTRVDLRTIVLIAAAATLVSAVLCIVTVWTPFAGIRSSGPERTRMLFAATLPIFATGVLQVAAAQADLWIVGARLDPSDVAIYGAAKRLMTLVGFPAMVLYFVIPPLIADLYARNERERLQSLIRGVTTAASLPATVGVSLFIIFGSQILALGYGETYARAATILQILCMERFMFTVLGPGSLVLIMTGHERTVLRITLISSVFSLLAIYLGGLLAGLLGIALGYACSSTAASIWYLFEAHRRTRIWVHVNPFAMKPMLEVILRMARRKT